MIPSVPPSDDQPGSAEPGDGGPGAAVPPSRARRAGQAARTVGRGLGATGRATARGSVAGARLVGRGSRAGTRRFREFAGRDGAKESGLAGLTELHAVNAAGDAAFTLALASTVLALPVDQARGQVAIFLATTLAPFVLLGPFVGPVLDRFRHGRRWAIGATLATRAFLSWGLAGLLDGSVWLLPVALLCLIATRAYAVARSAGLPLVLPPGITLVTANSRTSIAGIVGMVIGSVLAFPVGRIGPEWSLRLAFAIYVLATILAIRLPASVDSPPPQPQAGQTEPLLSGWRQRPSLPTVVRAILLVTASSRLLAGFLTLFLAFLVRDQPLGTLAPLAALGLVVAVAGLGNALGSLTGNRLGRRSPAGVATGMAIVAVAVAALAAARYELPAVLALALVTGAFGQLTRLCLDALVQSQVHHLVQARAFAWTETQLQLAWVLGGAVGIGMPLSPAWGFAVVAVLIAAALGLSVWIRGTAARDDAPQPS